MSVEVVYSGFTAMANKRTFISDYVIENLRKGNLRANIFVDREDFQEDKDNAIVKGFQATQTDYKKAAKAGWQMAHYAAFANHTRTILEGHETSFFTNCALMKAKLNHPIMSKLEKHIREKLLGKKPECDLIKIVTGVGFKKQIIGEEGMVSYGLIGPKGVAIPTLWWKLVLQRLTGTDNWQLETFVFDNTIDYTGKEPIHSFYRPAGMIEEISGVNFIDQPYFRHNWDTY